MIPQLLQYWREFKKDHIGYGFEDFMDWLSKEVRDE